jgi:hypothetical protein
MEADMRWRLVELTLQLLGYSPDSNEVSKKAEESALLRFVTKQRLVKTPQAGENLACSDL